MYRANQSGQSHWIALSPVTIIDSNDNPSRECFGNWLEENFEELSLERRDMLFSVMDQLIKLPDEALYYQGFLKLSSLKRQLNFLKWLSSRQQFDTLIRFLNIIEEDHAVDSLAHKEILHFLMQELQLKLSIGVLPKEALLQIRAAKNQFYFFKLLNLDQQFEVLRLLNIGSLARGIKFLKDLYYVEQLSERKINIQIFIKILTTLPQLEHAHACYVEQLQLELDFLEQFSKIYLQEIITTSSELIEVLNALPKDCWGDFLVKFDLKFLQKKIIDSENAASILNVLTAIEGGNSKELGKMKDLKKFLEKIIKKSATSTKEDKLSKYTVSSLSQPSPSSSLDPTDSHSMLMFKKIHNTTNPPATNSTCSCCGWLFNKIRSMSNSFCRSTPVHTTVLSEILTEAAVNVSEEISRQQQEQPRLGLAPK